jgi:acetyl esterase/lipase
MFSTIHAVSCGAVLLSLTAPQLVASDKRPDARPIKKLILPGESFLVEGRPAFILLPPKAKHRTPQPWIMYAPTLPPYPDKHEKWMHERFLAAGVAVAGIDVGESYGSPRGRKLMTALYKELTEHRGFAAKPCLLGRSRGGLWVSSWAIAHPGKVAGIAGIYPVFDLRSYPGLTRAAKAYNLTVTELKARLPEQNPIARIDVLAKARVPVCIIHGDADNVVPLKENSAELMARYRRAGAADAVTLIVATGQGHNAWEGFFRSRRLVEFAIARAKAGASSEQAGSGHHGLAIIKNVEYGRGGGKPLLLDLYRPTASKKRLPVVMWVHGGGWKNGSKDRCPATWLVEHGYAVASINYRLIDTAQWPAQIDDCRAAVRWLRVNAKKYGLDGRHIGVWGGSAGGHLVALLGTLDPPRSERVSSQVQAVCDFYGPSDLLTMPPNVLSPGRTVVDLAKTNGAKLLGGTVRDRPKLARQASALYQVSKGDPPFLIVHGDKDPGVPLDQSRRLHNKLKAAGVTSTLYVVKGAGHGGKAFQTQAVRKAVLEFFDRHLRETK